MDQVVIQPFGIRTTRIGFGCSSLVGLRSAKESRALIDAAYDAGIRHFDVARSYGYGAAEALLADALGSRRSHVTITSKFGIPASKRQLLVRIARKFTGPLGKHLPSGKAVMLRFTPEEARKSLTTTLLELKSDHLDLFLLHEADAVSLTDDGLLEFLKDEVRKGSIRGYGVGSDLAAIPGLVERKAGYCEVVQHEWSVLCGDVAIPAGSGRICHGAVLRSMDRIQAAMGRDSELAKSLNEAVGQDVSQRETLAAILLRGAAMKHRDAVTLFSARNETRIKKNVESLNDGRLDALAARLETFVVAHPQSFPAT